MKRIYGKSEWNPQGVFEDVGSCITEITDRSGFQYQCTRSRGWFIDAKSNRIRQAANTTRGFYCKQHAKIQQRKFKGKK